MSKPSKKEVRAVFRNAVFTRDNFKCKVCGSNDGQLDAHHIIDRSHFETGGYVKENGITLCTGCHVLAEQFHATGTAVEGFAREDLFKLIGSSEEKAREAAK